jgi:hypothetical protein
VAAERKRIRDELQEEVSAKVGYAINITLPVIDALCDTAAVKFAGEIAYYRGLAKTCAHQRRFIGELQAVNDALKKDNEIYFWLTSHQKELEARNKFLDSELLIAHQQLQQQAQTLRRLTGKWNDVTLDADFQ